MMQRLARKLETLRLRWRARGALARARESSQSALRARRGRRVLIVCHGNIYRSPFVAAVLRARLGDGVEIRSAGFHPVANRSSPARHVELCMRRGVDLSPHRSSIVTTDELNWADLVVLMDRKNWVALKRLGADESRLVWMGAFTAGDVEILDPYGMEEAAAEQIIDRLRDGSIELARRLGA